MIAEIILPSHRRLGVVCAHRCAICAGTESIVDDLVASVDLGKLCAGNLGRTFTTLKHSGNACPAWAKLKEAPFWREQEAFQLMHDVLLGKVNQPSAMVTGEVDTDSGSVKTAEVEITVEGKPVRKLAAWGTLGALKSHRHIHLCFVEIGQEGIADDIVALVEGHRDCCLVVMGHENGVFRTLNSLQSMKSSHPALLRYKTSLMYLFLKEDAPQGSRIAPQVNVNRRILLASPFVFKPHRSYVATDYTWRSSIFLHLVSILNLPAKGVVMTMLYVPMKSRPEPDILVKMGQFLAHAVNWQCSFVLSTTTLDAEVTATIKSNLQAAHPGLEQALHEQLVLQRGCCLNALTLLPPTKKSKLAALDINAGAAIAASTSSRSVDADEDDQQQLAGASTSSRSSSSRFQPPRKRPLPSSAEHSALEDRVLASHAKSAAETLEREAVANAAKAAKKARTIGLKQSAAKSRSKSSNSSVVSPELSLDDLPGGEY